MKIQSLNVPLHSMEPKKDRHSASDQMRQQIERLQKQIEKLKENKEASESTQNAIKELEEQIEQIQDSLLQATIQEKQKEIEEAGAKAAEKAEQTSVKNKDGDEFVLSDHTKNLLYSSQKFSEMKTLRKVQTDFIAKRDYVSANRVAGQIIGMALDVQQKNNEQVKKEQEQRIRDKSLDDSLEDKPGEAKVDGENGIIRPEAEGSSLEDVQPEEAVKRLNP